MRWVGSQRANLNVEAVRDVEAVRWVGSQRTNINTAVTSVASAATTPKIQKGYIIQVGRGM